MSFLPFRDPQPANFTVFLGRHSQELPNPHEVSRGISQIIKHPAYDPFTYDNDMALLQLSAPVNFTTYIKPACLAAAGSTFNTGMDMWVSGWGNVNSGGEKKQFIVLHALHCSDMEKVT